MLLVISLKNDLSGQNNSQTKFPGLFFFLLYFERDKRVTYVVTMEKEYTVDDKIQEIEERIAREDFVRCHTSFLVNFSYVKECTKKKMLLENGKIVDVSRSYWKKTEDAYVEWVKRWAR